VGLIGDEGATGVVIGGSWDRVVCLIGGGWDVVEVGLVVG
jgi:hypothetical protein